MDLSCLACRGEGIGPHTCALPVTGSDRPAGKTAPWTADRRPYTGGPTIAGGTRPQFGKGTMSGVQPTYYGFRCFGVTADIEKVPNPAAKDDRNVTPSFVLRFTEDADTGILRGPVQHRFEYHPGINVADCGHQHAHTAPDASCQCGFYAYLSPDRPDAQAPSNAYTTYTKVYVHGVVALSGKRLIGTAGIRAERLKIMALAGTPAPGHFDSHLRKWAPHDELVEKIAARLRERIERRYPDVPYFDTVPAMLRTFPLTRLATEQDKAS